MRVIKTQIFRCFLLFAVGLLLTLLMAGRGEFLTVAQEIKTREQNATSQAAYDLYWQGRYAEAITIWETQLKSASPEDAALLNSYLGTAYRHIGQLGKAISYFNNARQFYQQRNDANSIQHLASLLIEQGKTHNENGQRERTIVLIQQALSLIERNNLTQLSAAAYQTLGTAHAIGGDWQEAINYYQKSRDLASIFQQTEQLVSSLNDLYLSHTQRRARYLSNADVASAQGNETEMRRFLFLAGQDYQAASVAASSAIKKSQGMSSFSTVRAMLNLSKISANSVKHNYLIQAEEALKSLPSSRQKAKFLLKIASLQEDETEKKATLTEAVNLASVLGDPRTESYAFGELGRFYQQKEDYQQALHYTQQAQMSAQQIGAVDSLYRWQWQAGRIYNTTGQVEAAKKAYRGAMASLQTLRFEVAQASGEFQLDLSFEVEPVYREFLSLLLRNNPDVEALKEGLEVKKQLQFTELQSFFGDACLEIEPLTASEAQLSPLTAKINTVILEEATYIILELPNSPLRSFRINLKETDISLLTEQWGRELETTAIPLKYQQLSQYFYKLLIEPLESDLVNAQIQTLLFVNDGLLRNVPMAALHDGKNFLIEKYAVINSLGLNLNLITSTDHPQKSSIFGLTLSVDGFPSLPYVARETSQIQKTIGGETFLDESFTEANFRKQMSKNYPIVHLATHAEFGGSAKNTFVQTFEKPIFLPELEQILSQRQKVIELLTLSACQTATGNSRAILGLAGVALRSGTKNVLASLWSVDDKNTSLLIPDFYRFWKQGATKAQALQKVQLSQIAQNMHPKFWATFILIEN